MAAATAGADPAICIDVQSRGLNTKGILDGILPFSSRGKVPVFSMAFSTAWSQAALPLDWVNFIPVICPLGLQITSTSAAGFPRTDCSCESEKVMLGLTRALSRPK